MSLKKVMGSLAVTLAIGLAGCGAVSEEGSTGDDGGITISESVADAHDPLTELTEPAPVEPAEQDAPREYTNALREAESYLRFSAFSYQGLYDQLTSEYGSGFTPEAAQYAVDNVEVDWNDQALKDAESYLEFSAFSKQGLYDQLTSEYGSGFTPEQAQHAVDTVY